MFEDSVFHQLLQEDRCLVMGVVNVTPDSFSDGGLFLDSEAAIAHGLSLVEAGADILDIGGESSRPAGAFYGDGAVGISVSDEMARVIPVIQGLAAQCDVPLSIDTAKSEVAQAALHAGATIVNDISGFQMDEEMVHVVARNGCHVVLMHMRGTPQTTDSLGDYGDVVADICKELQERIFFAEKNGVPTGAILTDPGIGFGKSPEENLALIYHLDALIELGCPVLMGPSRKSFIGASLGGVGVEGREWGTAAAVAACVLNGAKIVRVHDVSSMGDVVRVSDAIRTKRIA